MAEKFVTLRNAPNEILKAIDDAVLKGSVSASLESSHDFAADDVYCYVRVYERFSYAGSNRVSMTVTLFCCCDRCELLAVTSGGSQAMFFKINTWGEEAFLESIDSAISPFLDER
ncbi:MAG TPA: DUF6054 family protein [Bacillota bacterium]|nr:DUF6054 family protein [Bacillota bacterium]